MKEELKKVNKVIVLLTLSDVLVWGMYLVAYPLQGVYMTYIYGEKSVQYIAIGLSTYYVMRALFNIPIGYFVDKTKKDVDEILTLALGSAMIGLSFMIFPFISTPLEYYLLKGLEGIGAAFNLIGWRKLFARNLSKNKEGREYAAYETVMSLSTAALGIIGGSLSAINHEIFRGFFFVAGVLIVLGGSTVAFGLFKSKRKSEIEA